MHRIGYKLILFLFASGFFVVFLINSSRPINRPQRKVGGGQGHFFQYQFYTEEPSDHLLRDEDFNNEDDPVISELVDEVPLHEQLAIDKFRVDKASLIRIYDYVWTASAHTQLLSTFTVCLSTQSSLDRLYWVPFVVDNWQGPVSLAVYVTTLREWFALSLLVSHCQKCYPTFRDFVSIHVAAPYNFSVTSPSDMTVKNPRLRSFYTTRFASYGCNVNLKALIEDLTTLFSTPTTDEERAAKSWYPQNHMRNLARFGCGTEWTFPLDVDIIPAFGSAWKLQEFLESREANECSKCVFVVPTFELEASRSFPLGKEEVLQEWEQGNARPFHFNVYKDAHNATNYEMWKTSLGEKGGNIEISHDASTGPIMNHYEPFYLGKNTIPAFPERFIGYGFTRSSQVQATLYDGWTFKVLSPIFTIHYGLQEKDTLYDPDKSQGLRKQQNLLNKSVFFRFMEELKFSDELKKRLQSPTLDAKSTTERSKKPKPKPAKRKRKLRRRKQKKHGQ